ncbi:acyltransferase ChoActase/COT/CPT [Dacryopinax primogenitus]|uniref:Carnitine O-acetyltransferase, mitochondrial n=1 Tax=Dacryopinax primogenitus (strain DJM 731) TaxID=1858805 RepID=M5G4V0_DACPD|nr:acyltransferase ChoActase/COT/CPT [Dacryopinax primogenitus]EJU03250.1 acyltransferase ChoActase/COT/CPT [Dacryopinax primogenitus]
MSDPSLPPMHRYQPFIPSLPLPSLAHTIPLYLSSIKPHCTPSEYALAKSEADDFLLSPLAALLQSRLEQRRQDEEQKAASSDVQGAIQGIGGNWLADWWNALAYNQFRDPVVPWVSYYYVHKDAETREKPERRAAQLVRGAMLFRKLVESGTLEPDKMRQTPLDMSSFRYLFNSARYPHPEEDYTKKFDPGEHGHAVFVRKNRLFKLQAEGLRLDQLETAIRKIYALATESAPAPSVGSLTSAPRTFWASARALLTQNKGNDRVLEEIDSAVVVVALDEERPVTREEIGWGCWAGKKGGGGRGRWFDKHQFIVFDNARSGFLGEHSAMDGTPTLRMNEFILAALEAGKLESPKKDQDEGKSNPLNLDPEELVFEVNDQVKEKIAESETMFDEVMAKHEMRVLHYTAYGSDLIKSYKCSPDAWAQLVMQLAWHLSFSRPGVCYESCQTRKFRRGRTEVIRSSSEESRLWAEGMLDPDVSDGVRKEMFLKAVQRHLEYAGQAANGLGVDRHLLGLRMVLRPSESHPFLDSPLMQKTKNWEMSTSQLSSAYVQGWGYAEVVPEGYGLAYAIHPDHLRWTITCLKGEGEGGRAERMAWYIEEAAGRVRRMMRSAREEEKGLEREGEEPAGPAGGRAKL